MKCFEAFSPENNALPEGIVFISPGLYKISCNSDRTSDKTRVPFYNGAVGKGSLVLHKAIIVDGKTTMLGGITFGIYEKNENNGKLIAQAKTDYSTGRASINNISIDQSKT